MSCVYRMCSSVTMCSCANVYLQVTCVVSLWLMCSRLLQIENVGMYCEGKGNDSKFVGILPD